MIILVWKFLAIALSIGIFIGHIVTKWVWKKKFKKLEKRYEGTRNLLNQTAFGSSVDMGFGSPH